MISRQELNPHKYPETPEIAANLDRLLAAINIIRKAYGIAMTVTSGLRSQKDQQSLIQTGKSQAKQSKHLLGLAVDIYDPQGKLKIFLKANIKILESSGLYCEDFAYTSTWVHFQCVPPKSGKRFFIP